MASTPLSSETRSTWYRVIHDPTPTQVQRHGINLQNMSASVQFNITDTLLLTLKRALTPRSYGNGQDTGLLKYYIRTPDMSPAAASIP